ncbi:MAG: ABC transporter substrate-binding protein [Gordonia sp. (in: high G+C Gram-positive bacteria)]
MTAAALALSAAACSQHGSGPTDQLVLAETLDLGAYNPLLGYGELGVSPVYEGLLAPQAPDDTRLPDLVPSLAAAKPQQIAPDAWRVPLRAGVKYSDGSAFDSADVVATYRAAFDPVVAASISTAGSPISSVDADGPEAVVVHTTIPVDPSPYLLLGIVPSESVEQKPAADWKLNKEPIGTGPYRLDSLSPDQAVFVARTDYRGGEPALRRVVYVHVPDDNARAQRVVAGETDGASLPPKLATSLRKDGVDVVAVHTSDWRGVTLPRGNAFTADLAARRAMNAGVDRSAIVTDVLGGFGSPASTPVSPVYGAAFDPAAQFSFDSSAARRILDDAGWLPGPDGVRRKGRDRAAFTLLYDAADTLRRDLTVAFAAAMKPLGVSVTPKGSSWDDIETRLGSDAVLLGGGDTPYSIASQVDASLHTREAGSSPYDNPGNFTAPGLDALLDGARKTPAGPGRDAVYRQIQNVYRESPASVYLVFLHHTYVSRSAGWTHAAPILEPHSHGVTWGPWWNLPSWRRA